jgi:ketosteroid isomerase-like protein
MSTQPPPQHGAVLEANDNFYRAFTAGDYAAMRALWAEHAAITCLHPGSSVLVGQDIVLQSWRNILAEPAPVAMRCDYARVHIYGETAVVLCYEGNARLPAHLAATNVFVWEADRWRMVHHHAGPLAHPIPASPANPVN